MIFLIPHAKLQKAKRRLSSAQREVVNLILLRGGKSSLVAIRQRLLSIGLVDDPKRT
jgi:hypothetical protein